MTMSDDERGRANKIGEGRKTESRSSSRSSTAPSGIRRRPPSPGSDSEPSATTSNEPKANDAGSGSGTESSVPLVRPAISKWGNGLATTAFGTLNTSSSFFKPHVTQATGSADVIGTHAIVGSTPNLGPSTYMAQPSVPNVQARNNQRSVSDASSEASATAPASYSRASSVPALPVPLSLHDFISPQSPVGANAGLVLAPMLPAKANIPIATQPILPTKVNVNSQGPTSHVPQAPMTSILPTKVALPSSVQTPGSVAIPQPILPTKAIPPTTAQNSVQNYYKSNLNSATDTTSKTSGRSYYRNQASGGSSTGAGDSSEMSVAVENMPTNATEPIQNTSTTSQTRRKGKRSTTSNSDASGPQRKKRGDWRVKDYRADPAVCPAPEPAANQAQNIGRHRSTFKAFGYQTGTEAMSSTVIGAQPPTVGMTEEQPDEMDTGDTEAIGSMSMGSFPDSVEEIQPANPVVHYGEEIQERTAPSSPVIPTENSFSETLVSRGSLSSYPSNSNVIDLQSPFQDGNNSSINNDEASTSQVPQVPQVPTVRLVAVVIEDNRYGDSDEQLVEMKLPLKPAKDGTFWADAYDVCNHLQYGPSRIDGPAKVFAYRGKYRQFFLRVSADNKDNFASANLAVTSKRTLRIYVEPGPSHPALPMDRPSQLASPAPSSHSDNYGGRSSQPPKRIFEQPTTQNDGMRYSMSPGPWHPQPQGHPNKRQRHGSTGPHGLEQMES